MHQKTSDTNAGKGRSHLLQITLRKGMVTVNMYDINVSALVDTGASVSCISLGLFRSIFKNKSPNVRNCHYKLYMADGAEQTVRKMTSLTLEIEGKSITHTFLILPKLNRPIILGVDFLKAVRATIDFTNLELDILTIRAPHKVVLPPMTEVTLLAHLNNPNVNQYCLGVTENLQRSRTVPFLVKRALVTPTLEDSAVPITVFNTSRLPYKVNKGAIMALFSKRQNSDFVHEIAKSKKLGYNHDFDIDSELTKTQLHEIRKVLEDNKDVFVGKNKVLGSTTLYEHRIDLRRDYTPINIMPYRASPERTKIMEDMLKEQEAQGVIERCEGYTEWASPAFLVEKPRDENGNRQYRLVVDFRHLNSQIKDQARSFPRADDTIQAIGQLRGQYFSKLDAYSGFFQIPLRPKDRHLTAFTTPGRKWHYRVMPMGLKTSPKAFHSVIETALRSVKSCLPYVDDLVVASPTWDDHLDDLKNVFNAFRKANIKFKTSKCSFGYKSIPFLGFIVSADGIRPNPEKADIISKYPVPKSLKQLRSFCGLANYYRTFIPNYSAIMIPLYKLIRPKTKFRWNTEAQTAFDRIKKSITSDVLIHYPDFLRPFVLSADASDYAIGACLSQNDKNNNLRPVSFVGRKLRDAELNYSTTDRELLALKFALEKFEHFIIGRRFLILTDHAALLAIQSKVNLTGRMARWLDSFSKFDFEIRHVKGKMNIVPDALSRMPYDDVKTAPTVSNTFTKSVTFNTIQALKYFHHDDYLENNPILIFKPRSILKKSATLNVITRAQTKAAASGNKSFSGAQNSSDNMLSDNDRLLPNTNVTSSQLDTTTGPPVSKSNNTGSSTNNETNTGRGQLPHKGKNKTKHKRQTYINKALADRRRKKIHQRVAKTITPENYLDVSQYMSAPLDFNKIVQDQQTDEFASTMIAYITQGLLPENNTRAREILLTHDHFFIHNKVLFRQDSSVHSSATTASQPQVVIPQTWIPNILFQLHDSPIGAHLGVRKLLSILKPRFFWQSMVRDIHAYVGTCHKCLQSKHLHHKIRLPMTIRDPAPSPFSCMSIDTIGPMTKTNNGNKYIHVVVDYYSRYVFSWATKEISAISTAKEFFKHVICHVGVPHKLFSDNGSSFTGEAFKKACMAFGIRQIFGSPYRPTTQGLVERNNQTIITSLRTYLNKYQTNWDEFLPAINFALNISDSYSLGYSPFLLVHGRHAVTPPEAALTDCDDDLASVQSHLVSIIQNQTKYAYLAFKNLEKNQKMMKHYHDKKIKVHKFEQGDLVYVKNQYVITKNTSKKLQPLYSGPYIVLDIPSKFTVKLRRLSDGRTMERNVHMERVKPITNMKGNRFLHRLHLQEESTTQQK